MRIIELTLTNFQGIRSMQISFAGKSASIFGDNATGKTTVFNAITWLLFDRPGNGAKNFNPKTKGKDGDLHNLEHSAEAAFIDGDRLLVLKKTFHEVYKKKRGSAAEEFDGHTVDYYVNGVPVKEKEYTAAVLSACGGDPEIPKLLTMPDYFSEGIAWEARRRILLAICGDISDEEVIDSTPELRDLPRILLMPGTQNRRYTVDDYRKIASARRTEINRALNALPGRIDEASRAIPDVTGSTKETVEGALAELALERERLLREKEDIVHNDTASAEIRKQMAVIECRMAQYRSELAVEQAHVNDGVDAAIREAKRALNEIERETADITSDIGLKKRLVGRMRAEREELLAEYDRVSSEQWDSSEALCPTCKRPLPEEDVEYMREQFNIRKSRRLEDINAKGRSAASKTMIEEAEGAISSLEDLLSKIPERRASILSSIEELEARRVAPLRFEDTNGYHVYTEELARLRERLNDAGRLESEAVLDVDRRMRTVDEEIRAQNEMLARLTLAEGQRKRIAELEAEEKRLAVEFEELELGLYLCDLFIRTKVRALTEHVAGAFRTVRFRLFREQINGGLAEDCEVMIPAADGRMVPYTLANSAARINAGLEIIEVLSRHYGVEMPIVVDNAESVTRLSDVAAQVIRLVVSEGDPTLRVEINEKEIQ